MHVELRHLISEGMREWRYVLIITGDLLYYVVLYYLYTWSEMIIHSLG